MLLYDDRLCPVLCGVLRCQTPGGSGSDHNDLIIHVNMIMATDKRKVRIHGVCGDYCGGCGQYNGRIVEIARQMREFADLYGFEFRSEGAFDFKEFVRGLE